MIDTQLAWHKVCQIRQDLTRTNQAVIENTKGQLQI